MPPAPSAAAASVSARVSIGAAQAERIFAALGESFDSNATAVAASDHGDGRWTISLHFRDAPNQTAVRALVALAAGGEIANTLQFENHATKDWVEASLA